MRGVHPRRITRFQAEELLNIEIRPGHALPNNEVAWWELQLGPGGGAARD